MTTGQLYEKLSEIIPKKLSCDWDNDGLMYCVDKERQVKRVLISLDVTLDVINYAVSKDFDTIVSHHPLIFKPLTCLDFEGAVGARLKKIIKHDITVMSFHTRLDCVAVNACLADALGLTEICEFYLDELPMGRIGLLEREMSVKDFAFFIKESICATTVGYPSVEGATVKKIAVLGGSGSDAVSVAMKLGADALVTGECSYNKMLDAADCGLYVFTAGHFETENKVCGYLYNELNRIDENIYYQIYNSGNIANI